jgi:S-(hydroxymethyl)glutathione dehydrogenase/alcohol dehydrogenase
MIVGHEAAGVVESVGEGVTSVKPGDHVVSLFQGNCGECDMCKNPETNYCTGSEAKIGNFGLLDGTCRFSVGGTDVYQFVSCGTFSQYSVAPEANVAKINPAAPIEKCALFGCCIPTGYGAAVKTAKVRPGSTCAIWGLGAVGLCAVMGCKAAGASRIIGIDINPDKFPIGKTFGCTELINPKDFPDKPIYEVLLEKTGTGLDYAFECIGNTECIESATKACKKGCSVCVMVGIPPAIATITASPLQLILGLTLKGSFMGGYKSREAVPLLVEDYLQGKLKLDELITHTVPLEEINEAFELLKSGKSLRTMLELWK